jgi:PAS domain S-box-containing protein
MTHPETSEALLRSIFDNMLDAYIRADQNGRIVVASPSAARMYGYASTDEMIGLPTESFYVDTSRREAMLRDLRENGRVSDYVGQGRKKDGTTFWVSLSGQVVRDDQGEVLGIEGFIRDITERKRSDEALRRAEERFEKAFHHSPDAINISRLRDGR